MRREKTVAIPRSQAEYLGITQAVDLTGLSAQTIRKLIADNELPAYRIGRNIRIRRDELEAVMKPINAVAATAKRTRKGAA